MQKKIENLFVFGINKKIGNFILIVYLSTKMNDMGTGWAIIKKLLNTELLIKRNFYIMVAMWALNAFFGEVLHTSLLPHIN